MISRETLYGIQFFISILRISSTTLSSDHTEKILNTENIILLMKDFDDYNTNDLEVIKSFPNNFAIDKKLRNFHRLVRAMKATEKAQLNHRSWPVKFKVPYPDPSFDTASSQIMSKNRKMKRRPPKFEKPRSRQGKEGRVREKRALAQPPFIINNHRNLERQYEDFVAACQRDNTAYRYTEKGKPEENVYDAISKILEVNFPKNCTNITGVGFGAIKCLLSDVKNGEINKEQLLSKIWSISFAWICIYLAIAMILWCTKGWCCCCFRCSFCFPNKTIRNIKKYLKENPPGFYRDPKGRVERYHASAREKELYEILTKSVEQY